MVIILIFEGLSYYTDRYESGLHVQWRDNFQGKRGHKNVCVLTVEWAKTNPLNLYSD